MFNNDEKKELKRLLHVAIIHESDRMNLQGVENAVFLIKKIESTNESFQNSNDNREHESVRNEIDERNPLAG